MPNETPLSDLFTSLKMLQDGAQQVAVSRAVSQASEDVNAVHMQEMDDTNRLTSLRGIATDLTMKLAGMGVKDDEMKAVSDSITGGKEPTIQSPEQGYIMGNDVQRQRSKQLIDQDNALKMALVTEKGANKVNERNQDKIERAAKSLMSGSAKDFEALKSVGNLESLAMNKQPVTDNALANLMSRSTGDVGNITEAERDQLRGSQAWAAKARRRLQKGWDGTLDDEDRRQILTYARIMKKGSQDSIKKRGALIAHGTAKNLGLDANDVMEKILPSEVFDASPADLSSGGGSSATSVPSLGQPGSLKSLLIPRN